MPYLCLLNLHACGLCAPRVRLLTPLALPFACLCTIPQWPPLTAVHGLMFVLTLGLVAISLCIAALRCLHVGAFRSIISRSVLLDRRHSPVRCE